MKSPGDNGLVNSVILAYPSRTGHALNTHLPLAKMHKKWCRVDDGISPKQPNLCEISQKGRECKLKSGGCYSICKHGLKFCGSLLDLTLLTLTSVDLYLGSLRS